MWVMNYGLFLLYFFIKKSDVMRIENYFVKELKVFFYCYFVENKRNLFVTFLGFPLSIDLNYYFCKKTKRSFASFRMTIYMVLRTNHQTASFRP